MTTFVVVAALLVAAAFAWLLPPLLRGAARGAALDREQLNLRLLREQRAELDADLARGTLSPEQHAESRAEIERRVLEETEAQARAAATPAPGGRMVAAAVAVVLPVAAVALYVTLGDPGAIGMRLGVQDPTAGHAKQPTAQEIEAMLSRLAQRLEKEPGNAEGWAMLARSYYVMQRYGEAVRAYERLVQVVPGDADVLSDYADALAMRNGRRIVGKPLELVRQALKIDPNHAKALAMAGTEAFDRKDFRSAVDYWEKLRAVAPPDSEIARNIDGSIAEARSLGGLGPDAGAKAPPAALTQAPAPAAKAGPKPAAGAQAGATLQGMVRLDPALAARAAPTDTVFVFARAMQGPRVPLAVLRLQAKDLPAKFVLDDSLSMAPQFKLSAFKSVLVNARVSRSGSANPSSGDLEGQSVAVDVGARDVTLVIDRVVP